MNCVGASSPWARQPADDISPVSVAFGPSVVHSTQPGATTTPGSVQGPLVSSARHTPIASTIPTHPQPSYRSEPPLHYWTPSASAAPDNYANYAIAGCSSPYVDPTCSHGGGVASVNTEPNVRRGMSAAVAHSKPFEPHPYAQYQPRVPMPYAGPYESHGNASPSDAPRTAADGADGGSGLVGGVLDMIGMHEKNLMDERTAAGAISLLDVWASRCESFESVLTENTEEDEEEEEDYGFFVEDSEWDDGSESRKPAWPTANLARADRRKPLAQRGVFQPMPPSHHSAHAGTSSSPDAREPPSPRTLSISSPSGTKTVTHGQVSAAPLPPSPPITVQPHCQGGCWPPPQKPSAQPGPPPAHMTSVLSPSAANAPPFVPAGMAESEMGMYFHSLKLT